jgi:hypothetical protein
MLEIQEARRQAIGQDRKDGMPSGCRLLRHPLRQDHIGREAQVGVLFDAASGTQRSSRFA